MRFKLLIRIIVCIQIGFLFNLDLNRSFAEGNGSFGYWQDKTLKNPTDAQAWFNLGVLYEKGQGIAASQSKAQQSYVRSVELGYAPAMFNLGSIYAQKKDYANAKFWWEKAAQKDVPEAQYNLATLYEKGWGVKQDSEKAAIWYQRAAETAMQKYLDLYQQSKQKLRQQSALSNTSVSFFNRFSIIPTAQAATSHDLGLFQPEQINKIAGITVLAQAGDSVSQKLSGWPWVYAQPEENFTIQLFATKEETKTAKFIQQYALTEQAQVIPAIVKNTQYYKVILGSFSEWNAAAAEIGALPKDLRDQRPWVRKFSSLYPELPEGTPTTVIAENEEAEPVAEQQEEEVVAVSEPEPQETESLVVETEQDTTETVQAESVETTEPEPSDNTVNQPSKPQSNEPNQMEQSEEQIASLDKQQPEIKSRLPEKSAVDDSPVDDVFTLYAKTQLNSSGLSDAIRQQLQSGLESIKAEDHASGFEQLAPLAQAGLPEAQYRVALLYSQGQGVGIDQAKGFEYMKLAAEQGHPYAQRSLAEFYTKGIGVEASDGLAAYWQQTADDNIKKLEELVGDDNESG